MKQKLFYEFSPRRGKENDKAILFSSGLGAVNYVLGVKKSFKPFNVDFYSFGRDDNAQKLDELKEFKEQNKDNAKLKVMPKCDHFDILEKLASLYQIIKFLKIKR